mgnify:CR=1 FL=1
MAKRKANTTPIWQFLFSVYCTVMLWLLFFRSDSRYPGLPYKELLQQNTNLIPFYTIKNYLHVLQYSADRYMRTHCFMNLAGNIVLFIPAGWLLPKLWGWLRNFFRFFIFCTGVIFLVETLQLFTLLGRFDIDDLILNLFGMVLGFVLFAVKQNKLT